MAQGDTEHIARSAAYARKVAQGDTEHIASASARIAYGDRALNQSEKRFIDRGCNKFKLCALNYAIVASHVGELRYVVGAGAFVRLPNGSILYKG